MKAWINHFCLNVGAAIACIWYAIVPPHWTGHSAGDIQRLNETNPIKALWEGLTS